MKRAMIRGQRPGRSGFALLDVILGSLILGIGLTVLLSISSRSLAMQNEGEHQMVASWLADEILSMVQVEGPVEYPRLHDTSGRFDSPFEMYSFDVDIEDQGIGEPYRVTAVVSWPHGPEMRFVEIETLLAAPEAPPDPRQPLEPVDRTERWFGDEDESGKGG
jgi:hypothetical protein